ncbi:hypothetical protein [Runella sp.]|uniref:monooxygenase n=1 Tax=Runella sp. TaxID=1960881 RepID=UPI003D12AD7C
MNTLKFYYSTLTTAVITALLVGSCQTKETEDVLEEGSFKLIQTQIFEKSCATSGCHASEQDAAFRQHGLVLKGAASYDNLVNKFAKNTAANADSMRLVMPGNVAKSFLFTKINCSAASQLAGKQYGNPMPLGANGLSIGEIEFVRKWIEAGAPRSGGSADASLITNSVPLCGSTFGSTFTALEAPKAADGLQLHLEPFEVANTYEREIFVRKPVGNTTELYINRVQSRMRPGSHHFILYDFKNQNSLPTEGQVRDLRNSDGTSNLLTFLSMQNHIFWAGTQTQEHDYQFPEGIALRIPANYSFDFNSHYVNKTAGKIPGEVYVNLYKLAKEKVKIVANSLNLANESFTLNAGQRSVVTKTFTFSKLTKVLMLTSHTHKLGEKYVIKIVGGDRNGEIVYESTDWEHPLIKTFAQPIELKKGEGLMSEVTYNNITSKTVKFGLTSEDEMDIIFGYYYEQ